MDNNQLKAIRLNTSFYNAESLKKFDCGDSRINDFFIGEAIGLNQENIFATTIYLDELENIVGFYSTSTSLLQVDDRADGIDKSFTRETIHGSLAFGKGMHRCLGEPLVVKFIKQLYPVLLSYADAPTCTSFDTNNEFGYFTFTKLMTEYRGR